MAPRRTPRRAPGTGYSSGGHSMTEHRRNELLAQRQATMRRDRIINQLRRDRLTGKTPNTNNQ